jgi:hypothetical protein
MLDHTHLSDEELDALIALGAITHGGHRRHGIYGRVGCRAERRYTARVNRVYFGSELEAVEAGFRPCSVCLKARYRRWRSEQLEQRRQQPAGVLLQPGFGAPVRQAA